MEADWCILAAQLRAGRHLFGRGPGGHCNCTLGAGAVGVPREGAERICIHAGGLFAGLA